MSKVYTEEVNISHNQEVLLGEVQVELSIGAAKAIWLDSCMKQL